MFLLIVVLHFAAALSIVLTVRAFFIGVEYVGLLNLPSRRGTWAARVVLHRLTLIAGLVTFGFAAGTLFHGLLGFLGENGKMVEDEWVTWRLALSNLLGWLGAALWIWIIRVCAEVTRLRHPNASPFDLTTRFVLQENPGNF